MAKKNRPIEQEQEADQLKSTPSTSSAKRSPSKAAPQSENVPDSVSSCSSPSLSAFELKPIAVQKASQRKSTPSPPKENKSDDGKGRWSFEDEISLLNAVIQYKSQIGSDPWSNWAAFLDYIEKSRSLQVKIPTKVALAMKVRKFKKDYLSIVKRNEGESENQAPVFPDPAERDLFHLCDKIWGSGENQNCSLKKVNLGPHMEEDPAKKSRGSEVTKEKEKEALVGVEEDKRKASVNKSNSGIILGLPIEEPPAKKRRRTEAKKQKETRVVMGDDENYSEKGKGKEKEGFVVMVEENGVNEDDDDGEEEENDANEGEDEKEKNDVNDDVEDKENDENDENEDDDAEEKGKEKEKGKVKETDVVREKHELYPRVFASMERRLAFMDKAHDGNVSDLRQVCNEIIEKADEEKLKDWESRWRTQKKVELEAFVGRKTLEIEESTEWLDIIQR